MSDRIAVMSDGVIQQVGDAKNIYDEPSTAFVASFVGENNPLSGKVTQVNGDYAQLDTPLGLLIGRNPRGIQVGHEAIAFIRPEKLSRRNGTVQNGFESTVKSVAFEGNLSHVYLKGPGRKDLMMTLGREHALPEQGEAIALQAAVEDTIVLPSGKMASE